eukprot:7077890-Prymnesium_polylepis.1
MDGGEAGSKRPPKKSYTHTAPPRSTSLCGFHVVTILSVCGLVWHRLSPMCGRTTARAGSICGTKRWRPAVS